VTTAETWGRARSMPASGFPGAAVPRRILVVGAGGREHALAWRLSGEPGVEQVVAAPGNPGMERVAEVHPQVGIDDRAAILALVRDARIELVVIGPEGPLVDGLADELRASGIAVFGPGAASAEIEGSKAFCREVATAAGVPMAEGEVFDAVGPALAYIRDLGYPVAVKADGLAAGKGVRICESASEAETGLTDALALRVFGAAGDRVVVERALAGREASVIAISDGTTALALPAARDHKRIGEGDTGPNSGGMGAYSPVPDLSEEEVAAITERFHVPVLRALLDRGRAFHGALYAGLMLTADGPRLLEFNARLGDPEAQAILPRLAVPLAPLLLAAATGHLAETAATLGVGGALLPATLEATVAVVLAAPGYPDRPETGAPIEGIGDAEEEGALVFHAGVARRNGGLVTAGGRVLTVVGSGRTVEDAAGAAYHAAGRITFAGRQMRRDVGRAPAAAGAVA
jgi:phosphoribosylamine--glycine ligase